jgi:hypothetical protein
VRERVLISMLLLVGCVFPTDDPTGLEVSWRFVERESPGGEEEPRVRTCEGAVVGAVAIDLVDVDAPERAGDFDFPCTEGFQTEAEFATEASDAFIQLRPSAYDVVFRTSDRVPLVVLAERRIDVLDKGLTVDTFEVSLPPVTWTLDLSGVGADACTEISFALYYDGTEAMLADPPRNDEGIVPELLYRSELGSDRGLSLGGEAAECGEALAGVHRFEGMDPGRYRLEFIRGEETCAGSVTLTANHLTLLDVASPDPASLANLSCDR